MIWFTNAYVYIVTKLLKTKNDEEEEFQLRFVTSGVIDSPEMSLMQVTEETRLFGEKTCKMFGYARNMFKEKENSDTFNKLLKKVEKYENINDHTEIEIGNFLNHIRNYSLSTQGENTVRSLYKIVDEMESIGDSCYNLAKTLIRKNEFCATFTPEIQNNINNMFSMTTDVLSHMSYVLTKKDFHESDLNKAYNKENEINNFRNLLRTQNLESVNKEEYGYISGIIYMDIISECGKIGNNAINVIKALKEKRSHK